MELKEVFEMDGGNEDLFFLSNGHISPVFYSVLARKGFPSRGTSDLPFDRLKITRTPHHPRRTSGVESPLAHWDKAFLLP